MPVQKFKTFEEADRALWCFHPDEIYYNRIRKLFRTACILYKPNYPKGVHKYKTFTDAQSDIDKWRMEYGLNK
jgi:hypothetical protein